MGGPISPTNTTDGLLSYLANNTLPLVAETAATFVYNETSALEQTVVTLTIATRTVIGSIWLDLVNVTQDTTIRVYHAIDGTNYRLFQENGWVVADDDGVLLDGFVAYRNIRITLQCGGGGIGNVNVPYRIV